MKRIKRENLRFYIFVGLFFIMAGLLLSAEPILHHWQKQNAQPFFAGTPRNSAYVAKKASISGEPTHIDIPSVGISIDITPGYYDKASQTWTLSTDKAQYATITPEPNDASGNTFIYGHNRWEVFYKLLKVQNGDIATITTSNNHTFTYKMTSRKDTSPTDSSLFDYQGPPILTLQTCSGFWYQNRSLFVFDFVKAV